MSDADEQRRSTSACGFSESSSEFTDVHWYLLITTVCLAVLDVILIIIIIFGYCKFVRKDKELDSKNEHQEFGSRLERSLSAKSCKSLESLAEDKNHSPPRIVRGQTKMRKRSMTFSETDEECRKYREGLADTYATPSCKEPTMMTPNAEDTAESGVEHEKPYRKKSVVTFVGVKE